MAKVRVKEAFFYAGKKGGRMYPVGEVCSDKDPVVKANPGAFQTPEEWIAEQEVLQSRTFHAVEAATAAPGEARNVKKPAAKKSAAKSPE